MAFCGKCGNQLIDGAKFCPKCGQPTNGNKASRVQDSKANYSNDEPEEEHIKTWQIIVSIMFWPAGVILLIGALIKKQSSLALSAFIYTTIGFILAIILNVALRGS